MSEEKRKQGDKTPESQRRQALVESMQRAKQEFLKLVYQKSQKQGDREVTIRKKEN